MNKKDRAEKGENYVLNTLIHICLQDKINELLKKDLIPYHGINDFFLFIHTDVIVPEDEKIPYVDSLTTDEHNYILGSKREAERNIFKPLRYCSPGDCFNISTPSREPTTVDEIFSKIRYNYKDDHEPVFLNYFKSLLDCEEYELTYKLRQFNKENNKHKYVIRKETIKSVVNVYSKYLQTHFYRYDGFKPRNFTDYSEKEINIKGWRIILSNFNIEIITAKVNNSDIDYDTRFRETNRQHCYYVIYRKYKIMALPEDFIDKDNFLGKIYRVNIITIPASDIVLNDETNVAALLEKEINLTNNLCGLFPTYVDCGIYNYKMFDHVHQVIEDPDFEERSRIAGGYIFIGDLLNDLWPSTKFPNSRNRLETPEEKERRPAAGAGRVLDGRVKNISSKIFNIFFSIKPLKLKNKD